MSAADPAPRQPRLGDAFGSILARCWAAGAVPYSSVEVVERDDGLISANDPARYFAAPEAWSDLERWAWEQATGRILDVGCGGGRHAAPWARKGLDVLGLDSSPGVVGIMRERGLTAQLGSLPQLPDGLGTFETIALFGNNLGLLGGPDRAPAVLRALAEVARPGTRILGTAHDPSGGESVSHHAAYFAWNRERGRSPGQLRIRVRDGVIATPWFDYWLATPDELATAVADTPWTLETIERASAGSGLVVCLRR
ncbi:class I SAM-dependent methyltransferase [Streptomyces sp. YJ-C3]